MEDDASMVGTDTSVTALTQALQDPHVEKVNKNDSVYFVLYSQNVQNLKIILRPNRGFWQPCLKVLPVTFLIYQAFKNMFNSFLVEKVS